MLSRIGASKITPTVCAYAAVGTLAAVLGSPTESRLPQEAVPEPVPPIYETLKSLHLRTNLVAGGEPGAVIIAPASGLYDALATRIQHTIRRITGTTLLIVSDTSPSAAVPSRTNLILLGNRSTNAAINRLYDLYYCILDLKYPGPGGYNVRTLHSPFGDGRNVVFVGASDAAGMDLATQAFVSTLDRAGGAAGELAVDHLMEIRLSPAARLDGMQPWDAGRQGAYGWNAVSTRMAMYYMTGRESFARDMLRYAFPDARTRAELRDKEFIDYRDSPLAEGSDYTSHLMAVFWDLIEESPVFTAAERLQVTNALARQLLRRHADRANMTDLQQSGVYNLTSETKIHRDDMHASYTALGLHTLGRYFDKDYPDPVWARCLRAAHYYFASFHNDAQFARHSDNLEWFSTEVEPVLTYMILSGWREPLESGALGRLLRAQETLFSGRLDDSALEWASLGYFNKAAYLTQDGRWALYRHRTGLDTEVFRIGQSFWSDDRLRPAAPVDLAGTWTVYAMPEEQRRDRGEGIGEGRGFYFGSFRSGPDRTGDFILLDGYNGEGRNPYHAFAVSELRLDGQTILQGYRNQVLVSANGAMESRLASDAALQYAGVVGDVAIAAAGVPRMSWATWRRVLVQRFGRYALFIDDLSFRGSAEMMAVETLWETGGSGWRADEADWSRLDAPPPAPGAPPDSWHEEDDYLEIAPGGDRSQIHEIRMADVLEYRRDPVSRLGWYGGASKGDRQIQFSLIAKRPGTGPPLACLRLASNAAALALPEAAIAVTGTHGTTSAELAVIATDHLFGHRLTRAGLTKPLIASSHPVEVLWDFKTGELEVIADRPAEITFQSDAPDRLQLDGRALAARLVPDGLRVQVPAGRHRITGARSSHDTANLLSRTLDHARAIRASVKRAQARQRAKLADTPRWKARLDADVGSPVADMTIAPSAAGPVIHVAAGSNVHRFTADGGALTLLEADGDIRVIHWWPERRLLLAGTKADTVVAFDEAGRRAWTFTLQFDPGFYGPGDDGPFTWLKYWPELTGVHGLYTGTFLEGKSQAFVGSTNTLDILDERGKSIRRLPVLRGMVRRFASFERHDGRITLLLAREPSDWDTLTILDNVDLRPEPEGFHDLPPGHRAVWAWMQNRPVYLSVADLDVDGRKEVVAAIDGVWNRVSVWDTDGTPWCSVNFPPGESPPYRNLRGIDAGDLNGDGKQEIVAATAGRVLVALDSACNPLWARRLPQPPTALVLIPTSRRHTPAIVVGDESGSILAFDNNGRLLRQGRVDGRPTHFLRLPHAHGTTELGVGTEAGRLLRFAW